MQLNSLMNDGQVQAYFSDAANAEVTYQTSGVGADVSAGGVRINMIPKEGGNRISGSAFAGGIREAWQGDNVTDELRRAAFGAATPSNSLGLQRRHRRTDQAGQAVVLHDRRGGLPRTKSSRRTSSRMADPGDRGPVDLQPDGRLTLAGQLPRQADGYYDRYPKFKGHEIAGAIHRA